MDADAATAAAAASTASSAATSAASSAASASASAIAALNSPATQATSTTSLAIGTGSRSLTLEQTGKAFAVGQYVTLVSTASTTNWMIGAITAFTSGTGAMTVNVTTINGSGTLASWAVSPVAPPLPSAATVSEFSVSGTWTKPAGATFVTVECWGAGGGGGSGGRYGLGSTRPGGGGGGGGAYVSRVFNANDLPSSVLVTIGAGGAGGPAQTTDSSPGNQGATGGNTSFGTAVIAYGGDGAATGSTSSNGAGGGGTQGAASGQTGGAPQQSPTLGGTIRAQAFGGGDGAQGGSNVVAQPSGFGGGGGGGTSTSTPIAPGDSSWGGAGGNAGGMMNTSDQSINTFFARAGYFGASAAGGMSTPARSGFTFQGMAFGNGTFVQSSASDAGFITTSANGTSWTTALAVGGVVFGRLWYDGTRWIAANSGNTTLFTSTDLATWRCVSLAASGTPFRGLAFANGLYVAVGGNGSILVSTNLTVWTARTSGTNVNLNDVIHDGTRFIAVGNSGVSLTSTDGSTWTVVTTASAGSWSKVASAGSVIVAQSNVTPFAWRSTNAGATWSPVATTLVSSSGYDGVLFANSLFVMAANTSIFTSTDGNTWTSRTNPTTSTPLSGVAYSGATWAIGLQAGGTNAAITSTDGTTWTTRTTTSIAASSQAGHPANTAGGGGGGAASLNGINSGAGGAGGAGFCRVTVV